MRVLVIGWEVSDFMCPLFDSIRKKYGVHVDLFELRPNTEIKKEAYTSFDNVLDLSLKISNYSVSHKLSSMLSGFFVKKVLHGAGIIDSLRMAILHKELKPVVSNYDVVHICYVTNQLFSFFDAIKAAKKIVVTWWGSDILQNNKDFDFHKQEKLVAIAQQVTVHQREMKELFLSKFGRELNDKVHEMLVVSDLDFLRMFYNAIPEKQIHINNFKQKHGIAYGKRVVVIGHSGHTIDNHVDIVNAISKYGEQVSEKICLIFPMTYGCEYPSYFDEIQTACEQMHVQYVILKSFLSKDELVELRLASEVLLRVSKFDAFSLSLCETLCAGNMVVTGTWLPYSKLKGNDVYFEQVYELENVGAKLVDIVNNYGVYATRCLENPIGVMKVFEKEDTPQKLYSIYTHE